RRTMVAMKKSGWIVLWSGVVVVAVAGVFGTGCSSGLKYKVDDAALDNVSAGEKKGIFDAKNESEVANSELRTAQSGLDALERDRDVAKNEKKEDALKAQQKAAEAHQKAAEAKAEFEKAKLAQQKNIKPDSDFSVGNYES